MVTAIIWEGVLCKDDPEFVQICVNLNEYCSHNFYRKFQHRNAGRCSGGVAVYYREDLKDGIEIISNRHDSLIWLKLDRIVFAGGT